MGLKEDLEKSLQEKQQQEMTQETYHRLCEEVFGSSISGSSQMGVPLDYSYAGTLPEKLSPAYQAVFDEFIELYPADAWVRCPNLHINTEKISVTVRNDWMYCKYPGNSYYIKVKFSDGSIHIAQLHFSCESHVKIEQGFFGGKKEQAKREAQQILFEELQRRISIFENHQFGSQDYIRLNYFVTCFGYFSDSHSDPGLGPNTLIIFRDGIVYAPDSCRKGGWSYKPDSPDKFYQYCLQHLTKLRK